MLKTPVLLNTFAELKKKIRFNVSKWIKSDSKDIYNVTKVQINTALLNFLFIIDPAKKLSPFQKKYE